MELLVSVFTVLIAWGKKPCIGLCVTEEALARPQQETFKRWGRLRFCREGRFKERVQPNALLSAEPSCPERSCGSLSKRSLPLQRTRVEGALGRL
jgi:hypothetical protein